MITATALLIMIGLYLATGCVVAVCFLMRGIQRVDPATRGTPALFKVLVFPGLVALWPIMAMKWGAAANAGRPDAEEGHRP